MKYQNRKMLYAKLDELENQGYLPYKIQRKNNKNDGNGSLIHQAFIMRYQIIL